MMKGELGTLSSFLQSAQVCRLHSPVYISVNTHSGTMKVHFLAELLTSPMPWSCPLSSCTANGNLSFAADGLCGLERLGLATGRGAVGSCVVCLQFLAKMRSTGEI